MPEPARIEAHDPDGHVDQLDSRFFTYNPNFIPVLEARRLTALFWNELNWAQYELTLFGRRVAQPRLAAWYGDTDARYRYSGLQLDPLPWHVELLRLKTRLQDLLGESFNAVLANAYRNGSDSMGWHADDERELGSRPLVASISLGAERRFLVRHRKGRGSRGIWLESGSLLVMERGCQQEYQHALPKTRIVNGLRINLTFRHIVA